MKIKNQSKLHNFFFLNFVMLCLYSCTGDIEYVNNETPPTPLIIDFKVPHDLPVGASQEDIANFAWNEFFALNWKAAWTEDSPNRFSPDKTWDMSKESTPTLAVWETYAHRTELRPANGTISESIETGKPSYTFVESDNITHNSLLKNSKYWNVLDEDNEIGSAYLFANKNESQVLYMAKTNLVEYNYLKKNYPDTTKLKAAVKKTSKLFGTLTKAQMCDSVGSVKKGIVCLPCGDSTSHDPKDEGTLEIKLAFKKLNTKVDDTSRFITKEVVVFKKGNNGKIKAKVDTLGLIGMHIIHKTKNYPAFIFASFEQVDVRNNNMQTIGTDIAKVNGLPESDIDPHRLNPVIERGIPETIRQVNKNAKALIKYQNPKSKWQYYQLIGTQATPVDYKNRTEDSNYFMANYVIESDLLLTNFHGKFSDPFNETIQNVALGKKTFNMGGCMGCHGIAQKNGSDFSFLVGNSKFDEPDLYQTYQEALQKATNSVYTTVSAKKGWIDTDIIVKPGHVITYELGKWTVNKHDGTTYDANGIKGYPAPSGQGFPLPGKPIGALVGKVGDYPAFFVGDGPTKIPVNQSGTLKLSINDQFGAFGDNKGSVTVKIQIK